MTMECFRVESGIAYLLGEEVMNLSNWKKTMKESRARWEQNADFWDEKMGEHSNRFHREIVRPSTEKLLSIRSQDRILDVACGNGNFSRRLAELCAVAFSTSIHSVSACRNRCSDSITHRLYSIHRGHELYHELSL